MIRRLILALVLSSFQITFFHHYAFCSQGEPDQEQVSCNNSSQSQTSSGNPFHLITFAVSRDSCIYGGSVTLKNSKVGFFKSLFYNILWWKKPHWEEYQRLRKSILEAPENNSNKLVILPKKYIKRYLNRNLGDKLDLISSKGLETGKIIAIGIESSKNSSHYVNIIKPLKNKISLDDSEIIYIIPDDKHKFNTPIFAYKEYNSEDSSFRNVIDSIKCAALPNIINEFPYGMMSSDYLHPEKRRKGYENSRPSILDDIKIKAYGVRSDTIPDTLMVAVSRYDKGVIFGITTIFYMIKIGNSWRYTEIMPARCGLPEFKIDFAFYPNDNKVPYYLVITGPSTCMIYTWENGEIERSHGDYFFNYQN
jgi:hypothetical protein